MSVIRLLSPNQEPAYYALARYAFNKPQSPNRDAAFASLFAHSFAWGSGEPLESGVLGTHFAVDFSGVTYQMSGIGYVASYPEASGRGGISAIMHQAFLDMRSQGETLSYLAPFSATFYRRFGYEGAFDQVTHEILAKDLPHLPKLSSELTVVRRPFKDAIAAMNAVYSRNKAATRGGLLRKNWWWQNMADHYPDREAAVALLADHPVGYVVYSRDGDVFRVHEAFYDDKDALLALLHFVWAHRTAFQKFIYTTGNPESLHDLLPDPSVLHTSIAPFMMARIVNVEDFLRRYPYQVSDLAPVVIGLSDDFIPENTGSWELAIDDGKASIHPTAKTPQVRLSEQQLVKASFGVRPLREAYTLGLADGDSFAAASLSDVFLTQQTQLYDYF